MAASDFPCGLAAPARRGLAEAGYTRIEQLAQLTDSELGRIHGMGPNAVSQIRLALESQGRSSSF